MLWSVKRICLKCDLYYENDLYIICTYISLPLLCGFLKDPFIYLRVRKKVRQRERSSFYFVIHPNNCMGQANARNQKLKIRFSFDWQELKKCLILCCFPGILIKSWISSRAWSPIHTLASDVHSTTWSLIFCLPHWLTIQFCFFSFVLRRDKVPVMRSNAISTFNTLCVVQSYRQHN